MANGDEVSEMDPPNFVLSRKGLLPASGSTPPPDESSFRDWYIIPILQWRKLRPRSHREQEVELCQANPQPGHLPVVHIFSGVRGLVETKMRGQRMLPRRRFTRSCQ